MSNLLKSKFLLGVMVVAVLVVGFAAFVGPSSASADCSIMTTLRLGSKGAEVSCLQTGLGGLSADGSFGPKTEAAVKAWQLSKGLVGDGVFGRLSRAAWTGVTPPPAGAALCPNGNTLASNCSLAPNAQAPAQLCPNGMTIASNCASAPGTTVVTGGQGSATIDYEPIPAAGVSIYTGASKQAGVTFKVRATGSAMTITSLSLDTGERIWLDASVAYLMQGSTVLATVPLNASNVVEVTSGSVWRINFTGFSVVAPAGVNTDLTVAFDRPTVTQNNNTVTIAITSYVRATDGTGFTTNVSPTSTRTMTFSASAATQGTLTASLNANTPLAQSVTGLSTTVSVQTPIHLMDFNLRGTNSPITVTALAGSLTSSGGLALASEVASVELRDTDGVTVLSSVTGASGTLTFSTLNIAVPKDGTKTLQIWARINPVATTVATGYSQKADGIKFTVLPASTTAFDANYNTVTDSSANVAGNYQYLFQYAPTFTLGTHTCASVAYGTGGKQEASCTLAFTVTAPSGSDIYIDGANLAYGGTVGVVKTTVGNGGTLAALRPTVSGVASTGSSSGYDIVTAGASRTFTISGYIPQGAGSAGYVGITLATNGIKWTTADSTSSPTPVTQTWGLSDFLTNTAYVNP